jgi:hypothetical protein
VPSGANSWASSPRQRREPQGSASPPTPRPTLSPETCPQTRCREMVTAR